ncbi:hypothetical protein [Anaerococcus hydrogenalis]|uniref:hypothetical protein n=1 Tax=Anaerococcus hydrogenalis TaxID=33029 RepID=UPI001E0777EE|nr:hypothetical protein [Anaerococcus hydrogenalis]MBS5988578.1 hypothetical protein [Anaerococcus hydrogenalis]
MIDLVFIILTICAVLCAIYQADKNKNKSKKSLKYKISKSLANILNFVTFLDLSDVNNLLGDIENDE